MPASSAVAPNGAWMHPTPHLTRLDAFRISIGRKYGLNLTNYTQLHRWFADEIESFCLEIWMFCGLVYTKSPTAIAVGIESMWPRPRWFPDARLNYTENVLIKGLAAHPDAVAVSVCREGGTRRRHLTWIDGAPAASCPVHQCLETSGSQARGSRGEYVGQQSSHASSSS